MPGLVVVPFSQEPLAERGFNRRGGSRRSVPSSGGLSFIPLGRANVFRNDPVREFRPMETKLERRELESSERRVEASTRVHADRC